MSRRSQAHAIRQLIEVQNSNGTRRWQIAVYTPRTRTERDPNWDHAVVQANGSKKQAQA